MLLRTSALLVASSLLTGLGLAQQRLTVPELPGMSAEAHQAAAAIDAAKIHAHVAFLASDLLEGRGPGTRGAALAAEYIATQFALSGLEPAGENGTYFQRVPLYAVHTDEQKTHFQLTPASGPALPLAYGSEIVAKDQTGASTASLDAPIVFVGYGINAPEYNWNDYAGVDVKGKVALMIVGEPPSNDPKFFKAEALTYYGRWTYKYEEAARRGAAGVLLIHRTDLAAYGWDVVRNSQAIEKSYLDGDPEARLHAAAWISHDVAQKLLTASGLGDVDKAIETAGKPGAFHAVELPVRLTGHVESQVRHYESANVLARLRGRSTGPAVLYNAHYDHLGIDTNAPGDNIYNGAADNATGCGILLEIARAFSQLKPEHDIYFVSVTTEEQGLLGSAYLGQHPPIPAGNFSLLLNYDMLLPIGIPQTANVSGAERTTFWPTVQKVAESFHLKLMPDPNPSAGHAYRSDHFSLARVGIPGFSIGEGVLFEGHDVAWGRAKLADFVTHNYHQPSDQIQPDWDFAGNARMAQFGFALGWLAAQQSTRVEWLPGDEFEAARLKNRMQ